MKFFFGISIKSRCINHYKMLDLGMNTEEKLTEIQKNLKGYGIKISKKTIGEWIEQYEQRIKEIEKETHIENSRGGIV